MKECRMLKTLRPQDFRISENEENKRLEVVQGEVRVVSAYGVIFLLHGAFFLAFLLIYINNTLSTHECRLYGLERINHQFCSIILEEG